MNISYNAQFYDWIHASGTNDRTSFVMPIENVDKTWAVIPCKEEMSREELLVLGYISWKEAWRTLRKWSATTGRLNPE